MSENVYRSAAEGLRNDLRLKTFPVAVKFLKDKGEFPEKTRQPSVALGKRIAICQGVGMARIFGWTVGVAREDVICVPAAIVFGFSDAADQPASLARLFCEIDFSQDEDRAVKEISSMNRFRNGEIAALVLAPLEKAGFDPDCVLFYGNPAQMMRLAQGWSYLTGSRVSAQSGGKVECDEYLITPFQTDQARLVIPGNGERIFAATQDDEMVFALPGKCLLAFAGALKRAAKGIGARYPITPHLTYQPEFPKAHQQLGKELGIL